jgi:hypothetical protein
MRFTCHWLYSFRKERSTLCSIEDGVGLHRLTSKMKILLPRVATPSTHNSNLPRFTLRHAGVSPVRVANVLAQALVPCVRAMGSKVLGGLLAGWLAGWLACWLAGLLAGSQACLLAVWLAGWLGTWLAGWLAGLLGRPGVPGGHRKGPGEPGGARLSCGCRRARAIPWKLILFASSAWPIHPFLKSSPLGHHLRIPTQHCHIVLHSVAPASIF